MKKVFLIVSIDTECDKTSSWEVQQPLSFKNILDQEHILFPLFQKHGIKPTYLLSPEVLKDDSSVAFFQAHQDQVELGTHLHEEFIEPNENMNSLTTSSVQSDLSSKIELEKLDNLTKLFMSKFNYQPLSFRAGRFGVSKTTLSHLNKLGYKVDSSYLPYRYLSFKQSEVLGWGVKIIPFRKDNVLEVPVTHYAENYVKVPRFILKQLNKTSSLWSDIARKIYGSRRVSWLRPLRHQNSELVDIAEYTIHEIFKKEEYAILNIMFHSNEITPNASPYTKTDSDVCKFVEDLDYLFNHLKKYELCSIGLGESCAI